MSKLTDKQRTEIAQFRLGLISPVTNNVIGDKSENEYFKELCCEPRKTIGGKTIVLNVSTLKT